jgi:hypothetical protein
MLHLLMHFGATVCVLGVHSEHLGVTLSLYSPGHLLGTLPGASSPARLDSLVLTWAGFTGGDLQARPLLRGKEKELADFAVGSITGLGNQCGHIRKLSPDSTMTPEMSPMQYSQYCKHT